MSVLRERDQSRVHTVKGNEGGVRSELIGVYGMGYRWCEPERRWRRHEYLVLSDIWERGQVYRPSGMKRVFVITYIGAYH